MKERNYFRGSGGRVKACKEYPASSKFAKHFRFSPGRVV